MKLISFLIILSFLLSGCVYTNERGISAYKYNDCKPYYDSMGFYHDGCAKNYLEYKEIEDGAKSAIKKLDYFELFSQEKQEIEEDEIYEYK